MSCGTFTSAAVAGGLTAWAQCWFLVLLMVVLVTVAVLFIILLVQVAALNRKI